MPELDLETLGKIKRGELKTSEVLPLTSDHVASMLFVGHVFFTQGRLEEARKIFEGLFVLDDKNPFVNAILGSIYQKQKSFPRAFEHYSRAIVSYPQDIQSLTNRGEILLQFGKLKQAAADFKAAIGLDPQRKSPAANRARLLAELARQSLTLAKDQGVYASSQQLEASLTAKN